MTTIPLGTESIADPSYNVLASAVQTWKEGQDRWHRERKVLLSIGGEAGSTSLTKFMDAAGPVGPHDAGDTLATIITTLHLDGLDIDAEDLSLPTYKGIAEMLKEVKASLASSHKPPPVFSCAPQAHNVEILNYLQQRYNWYVRLYWYSVLQ